MSSLSEHQLREIRAELQSRGKIAAVKKYKDWMKCSLLEAKNAVEAIESGGDVEEPQRRGSPDFDHDLREVDKAIARGEKLTAVKLYRELTGQSLRDSKAYVESRMKSSGSATGPGAVSAKRSGCFAAIVLVVTLAAGSAVVVGSLL